MLTADGHVVISVEACSTPSLMLFLLDALNICGGRDCKHVKIQGVCELLYALRTGQFLTVSERTLVGRKRLTNTFRCDEVILLKGQYASLQRQNNNGILKQDEYDIKLNRIKAAALSLAKKLPKDSPALNPTPTAMPTSSANQAAGIQRIQSWAPLGQLAPPNPSPPPRPSRHLTSPPIRP